jgi:hypothetical protein
MKSTPFILLMIVSIFTLGPTFNIGKLNLNCCSNKNVSTLSSCCTIQKSPTCKVDGKDSKSDVCNHSNAESEHEGNCNPFSCFSCTKHFFYIWQPSLSSFQIELIRESIAFVHMSIVQSIKDAVWHPPITKLYS